MAAPDVARIVPISDISASNIGQKFRLFGVLVLPEDPTSPVAQLHSITAGKSKADKSTRGKSRVRDVGLGLLVDMSLCVDDRIAALKETASVVMVMGTLEDNSLSGITQSSSVLVDESIILRAILITDASDVNLVAMESAIAQRRAFELDS
ncbi:hypothetical protein M408DRAFT_8046 [Serendipita vermifera MAFF 305830]|uniref:Uncharacterized protein n=1 Tax=Serendipita vermifera MAFF 305830 TaxID=933852 RepID=A0A0C3BCG7_SERVB|nr:hypothetical protein M408DRAFT_8046 [Serendipita vermifera MAFF 305830]